MDMNPFVMIGDSIFLEMNRRIQWCLDYGLIDSALIDLKKEQANAINAASIGLSCGSGIILPVQFYLITRTSLYKYARAEEICRANSIIESEKPEKKSARY